MARAIVAIIALGVLTMVAVTGFSVGLENAGKDFDVADESWTPDAGNVTELNRSNIDGAYYEHTVEVENSSGILMEAGVDYEWLDHNGTVRALAGGDLDGEPSATIDYSYQVPTQEQQEIAALLAMIPNALGALAPALLIVLLLLIIKG